MFERLGSLGFRYRFLIVGIWVALAVASVAFAPSIASEGSTDQASFLPPSVPSALARDATEAAFPGSTSATSATLTFQRGSGITDVDRAYVAAVDAWLTGPDAPPDVSAAVVSTETAETRPELGSMLRSEDGQLELLVVNLDVALAGDEASTVVEAIREHLAATPQEGLGTHVTGAAAVSSDYLDAIARGTDSTTAVTVVLVIVILLLIYRAPLAALVPLVTIAAAFLVARGALGVLASLGWEVASLLDTFIVVLVFGVGTDYAIFLISRYREEVSHDTDWHHASRVTVTRIGAVISASAATVIVGLAAMAFGEFKMIQTIGPALGVAIFITLIAGLTLAPALLGIFGHYLFWPRHMQARSDGEPGGFFARLAELVSRRPGIVTAGLIVALALPATYVPHMETNFDILSELPADSDARLGYEAVAEHLGEGKLVQSVGLIDGGPRGDMLAPSSLARARDLILELSGTSGVATVTSLLTPDGDGIVPDGFRPSVQLATIADELESDGSASTADADASALLDPSIQDGLRSARSYVEAIAGAYPDVAGRAERRATTAAIDDAIAVVERAREQSVLSTQLRTLADAATSPSAAASGDGSVTVIGAYLAELGVAYPEVIGLDAFADARRAAASLEREATIAAALDLADALDRLAAHFDGRPDATFSSQSLADTESARELRAEVTATFDALPVAFRDLAGVFEGRPDDIFVPVGLGGDEGAVLDDAAAAFVSADGTAMRFYLTTTADPYATEAFDTVRVIQPIMASAAPGFGPGAVSYLGGPTAQFADVQDVLSEDFFHVGVITVLGILLVLMVLLRAVVAPIYLVATVLLSYGSALGLSAWLFQEVLGQPGVSFYLPLIVFVLLVALGSDYNIFLMSRVREESATRPIRDGIRVASGHTGAVITSAGLILAGTFGSMATAPLLVLFQTGVAVALGVLIDTFVVRSILVPAITTVVGERAWWPSGLSAGGLLGWLPAPAATVPAVVAASGSAGAPSRRPSAVRLAAVVTLVALVPAVLAGLLTWSLDDPGASLETLPAAVVDEDVAATLTAADGTSSQLRLGDDLAAALEDGRATGTFAWVATDADDAATGLADGRYAAALTIPDDFSSRVAAIRMDRTGQAPRASLRLVTSDGTSEAIAAVARDVTTAIAATTGRPITDSYVGDVLLAVTDAHAGVVAAATDARGVATDTAALADDAAGVEVVAGEMVGGLEELAAGIGQAVDGSAQLADATRALASGTAKVAMGSAGIGDGVDAAADGAGDLAAGAHQVASGAAALDARTTALPDQIHALAGGASDVATAASASASGAADLSAGLATMAAETAGLGAQAGALDQGAQDLATGSAALGAGAQQAATGSADLSAGAGQLAGAVDAYTTAVADLSATCLAQGGGPTVCAQLAGIAATNGQLTAAASDVDAGASALAVATSGVAAGADSTAVGAAGLASGTAQLAASAPVLEAGIAQSAEGASTLASGMTSVAAGAQAVADGAAQLDAGMPALASGVSSLAAGTTEVATGADGLEDGLRDLASGTTSLTAGAVEVAAGADVLAEGTADSASGAGLLQGAVDQATDAARLLDRNAAGLATQGVAVAGDAAVLGDDLGATAAGMPGYSDERRSAMAGLAAAPVAVEATTEGGAPLGGGLAPFFLALGLWAGALAVFLVLPARWRASGAPTWRIALAVFAGWAAFGAVQALVAVGLLRLGLGIEVADMPALLLVAVLAGVAFAALVEAFVAVAGRRGWVLALLLLGLQVAAAGLPWATGTMPGPLAAIHPFLPLTWALDAMAAAIAGSGSIGPAVVALGAWLGGALVVLVLVAGRGQARPVGAAATA